MQSYTVIVPFLVYSILGKQHGYKFVHEYVKLPQHNESLVKIEKSVCFKANRTTMAYNISVVIKFDVRSDSDMQIKIIGYQFRSNEYRKGPIEFMLGFCGAIKSNEFDVPNILAQSNLKHCPIPKGRYFANNVIPNAENFPPFLPEGKWMIELEYIYRNRWQIAILEWYARVEKIWRS